jgi:hypothetical protein
VVFNIFKCSPSKIHVDLIKCTFKYVSKHKTFRPLDILLPFSLEITCITEKRKKKKRGGGGGGGGGKYNQVS